MSLRGRRFFLSCLIWIVPSVGVLHHTAMAQSSPSVSSSSKHPGRSAASASDAGSVTSGVYRNKALGFTCKIPDGWVLRTDDMNKPEDQANADAAAPAPASSAGAKVLLAAFSRPPEAQGEEVNASILIAAESAAAYPGLTDAAQYFFPLTEVAKAQGFIPDEDPYEIAIGSKTLVRGDFHKSVGTRVMRQSTMVMLAHGSVVSFTVIGGTDDQVEDLVDSLSFTPVAKK
jgi:hypothetical protein